MTETRPADRPKGLRFRIVAAAFVGTVVCGLIVALLMHRSFVAAERVAARHVPDDATAVLRLDLEKVVLFAPVRKVTMPLVNEGGAPPGKGLRPRAERLGKHSELVLGRDTRELVVAWGPGDHDWAAVAAGNYPDGVLPAFERVFAEEGSPWQKEQGSLRSPDGLALAQASDRALVLASSAERAKRVLPATSVHEKLGIPLRGALSFAGEPGKVPWLGALSSRLGPLKRVQARAEWSSPLEVDLTLEYAEEPPADLEARVRKVTLELLGRAEAERLKRAVGDPKLHASGRTIRVQTRWDHESLERLGELIEARLSDRGAAAAEESQQNAPR